MNYYYEDFTEDNYIKLLKLAKQNYKFISYEGYKTPGSNIIWRHDVDISMHRALRLAQLESEQGIKSTYFLYIHSEYYNLLEKEIIDVVKKIMSLGHYIGLHFDFHFYGLNLSNNTVEKLILKEKIFLEELLGQNIKAISFHMPEKYLEDVKTDEICGMVNTYGEYLKKHYTYCSDSNGYWRFSRLEDVLKDSSNKCLQILTHPAWWVPTVMSPRERISRAIDGRAHALHKAYDIGMKQRGRVNVK